MSRCYVVPRRQLAPLRSRTRLAREARGVTRRALARATGLAVARLRELDEAGGPAPTWPERQALAAALRFPTQWFNLPPLRLSSGPVFVCMAGRPRVRPRAMAKPKKPTPGADLVPAQLRTRGEIDAVLAKAQRLADEAEEEDMGSTMADAVQDTIAWLLGESDDPPMDAL